jgi:hypothetical protein
VFRQRDDWLAIQHPDATGIDDPFSSMMQLLLWTILLSIQLQGKSGAGRRKSMILFPA